MNRILLAIATVAAVVFAVPAIRHWRERPPAPPPPPQPLHAAWSPPEGLTAGSGGDYSFGLSLAFDGRRVVFPAAQSGITSLWIHDLRDGDTRRLAGTEGAAMPFWSSTGTVVGFFANGRVRAIQLSSGHIDDLAEAGSGRGAAWNGAGDLIFAAASGLMRRSRDGTIKPFTTLDGDTAHAWPSFFDDTHVIYLVTSTRSDRAGIWIAPLDDAKSAHRILESDAQAIVTGNTILYLRDRSLMAQEFDPKTLAPGRRPDVVGMDVGRGPLGQIFATASWDVLIYGAPGSTLRELKWVARDGSPIGSPGEPVDAWDLRIAPDGRRIVVTEVDRQLRTLDVFIRTASQPAPMRLSLSTDADDSGVWSPDGLRVAWAGQRRKVMLRGAGAVLPEQTIATFDTAVQVWDWSRDARALLISRRETGSGDDLWIQPPVEGAAAQPYVVAPFNQAFGVFSPDGRSIAYASDESGQFDIYVDSFPKPGNRARLTTSGGTEPRWSADGRELYFRRGSEIHALSLDQFEVRSTTKLFDAGAAIRAYDVSRDGKFLLNLPAESHAPAAATIVTNWKMPVFAAAPDKP